MFNYSLDNVLISLKIKKANKRLQFNFVLWQPAEFALIVILYIIIADKFSDIKIGAGEV